MAKLDYSRAINAPIETVFDVLTDHKGIPSYTKTRKVKIEKEGTPAPNGLGAIRALYVAGPPVREEVIGYDPPKHFAYKMLSGAPLKNHVGTVDLVDNGDGTTQMNYIVETYPSIPVIGHIFLQVVKAVVGELADGIKKTSEERAK